MFENIVFGALVNFSEFFYSKTHKAPLKPADMKDIFLVWPKWRLARKATEKRCGTTYYIQYYINETFSISEFS